MQLNDRLLLLIQDKFSTQTEAANRMGMTRQSLNAIVKTGKFSCEFILKLKEVLPELNLNWLMFNEGNIYLTDQEKMYDLVKDKFAMMGKTDREIFELLKSEVLHLRSQIEFMQGQIKERSSRQ